MADLAEVRWRSGDLEGAADAARAHQASGGDEPIAAIIIAEDLARSGRDRVVLPRLEDARTAPRGPGREIQWSYQPVVPVDEDEGIALVERMIAERDHVGPRVEKIIEDRLRDPEAARRVLPVHHDEIELPVTAQTAQIFRDRPTPRAAHHIP